MHACEVSKVVASHSNLEQQATYHYFRKDRLNAMHKDIVCVIKYIKYKRRVEEKD